MDITYNDISLFNKLPASILSIIFVFTQNTQLSTLNKNMYKASQKVETVSDYIVRYVSSDTGDSSQWNLRDIFDKYKRISMNETIGMLVLRKIKNLDYETALDMAFEYRWKNMLDKLLKMYVVIDRNTSTVVRKGTLFMDKDEYLDIDIGKLFSQDNESQIMKIDIKTSNSLYIRPLFRMSRASTYLIWAMHTISGGRDIEMLIDICNTKFEFPPEVCDSVGRDIRCIDDRFMICCMLVTARESCRLNSLELLKRVLGLEPNIYFPFQRLESVVDARGVPIDDGLSAFVWEYEYKTRSDLLSYTLCAYFSICWNRKKLIEYLEDNYYSSKHMQIFFDISVFHKNESLFKKYFFKVELNAENIGKITNIAYRYGNVNLIQFLLKNSSKLKGGLDENALKTAIKKKNHELVQEIINKYPNTVSISCLEEAVHARDIRIVKSLIETGVDLKSSLFKGIEIASANGDINILQFLLKNGVSVDLKTPQVIEKLCSIKNYEIAERILDFSDKDKERERVRSKTSTTEIMDRNKLKFSKTILCLIEVNKCYNQDYAHRNAEFGDVSRRLDLYEDLMAIINPRRKKIIDACEFYLTNLTDSNGINKIVRDSYDKLVETIGYIIENNLESTLEDAGYDDAHELECRNDSVVLNDEHYECAKSELVNRNFEILKIIIEDGGDINSYDSLILRTAYKAGDIGWIDYFIGKGAKFKGRSDGFEEACKSDKVEVLKHWIKNGGVVPKNPGYPCIKMACLLGNFNMVKFLVENGVDLGNPELNGVRIACRLGLKKTLKYLLNNNAVVGNICRYQLERACLVDDIELVKMILEHYDRLGVLERKDKTNTKNEEAQDISCFDSGNTDLSEEYKITKALLEKGKPIQNSDLLDVIRLVAIANSTESLELLLAYKFNFNDIYKILKISVQLGNLEAVKVFLRNDFNVNGDTVILKTALVSKKDKMARLLLQHGAKVGRDIYCYQEYLNLDDIETFQLMLTCCPEIGGNSSLLQYAIEKNKIEAVKLLLKDTTTLEDSEYNYILWACEINDLEILKLLLAKGANIREGGESGVIEACKNNNLEMLKLLLERNPNLVLEKVYGLETAIELENMEMVNLLIKYGADTSEYIESIMELADELDCDDLSESCEYNAGGFKKVKRT